MDRLPVRSAHLVEMPSRSTANNRTLTTAANFRGAERCCALGAASCAELGGIASVCFWQLSRPANSNPEQRLVK